MQKLMLEWADEFEGIQNEVFYELGTNVRKECDYLHNMPAGVAKEKLKGFLGNIRTLFDWLKTNQIDQLKSFKQEKVKACGSKLARGLLWQSMVTWFFAFEMMRRQDVHMIEHTYTEDDIPAMRERNTVSDIWEEWMMYGSYGQIFDWALVNGGNQNIMHFN